MTIEKCMKIMRYYRRLFKKEHDLHYMDVVQACRIWIDDPSQEWAEVCRWHCGYIVLDV